MSRIRILAAAVALAAAAPLAHAVTVTSNFTVSATVAAACTFSSAPAPMTFTPNYTGATDIDATTSMTITCSNGTPYRVYVTTASTFRRMTNGASLLNYELFSDSGRTVVFGNNFATATATAFTGTGAAQPLTIYGRVPLGQTPTLPGGHSQTATVVVDF